MSMSADTTRVRTVDAASTWWTTSTASVLTTGRARPAIPVSHVGSVLMCVFMFIACRGPPTPPGYTSLYVLTAKIYTTLCILDQQNYPFLLMLWIVVWRSCVTSVFLCNPVQARTSVTQPPAAMEAPATTTGMPSAVLAHLVGEETHATQVRPQDGIYRGSRKLMIDCVAYSFAFRFAERFLLCKIHSIWV